MRYTQEVARNKIKIFIKQLWPEGLMIPTPPLCSSGIWSGRNMINSAKNYSSLWKRSFTNPSKNALCWDVPKTPITTYHACNQRKEICYGSDNDAECVTPFPHMWACLGSSGRQDCQARRMHGFNYKYCWCLIFQVNKQQSAYNAGFSSVLIRLVKFKSLDGNRVPSFLSKFVFVRNLNRSGTTLPHVSMCVFMYVCKAHQYSSAWNMHFFWMGSRLAVKAR